MPTRPLRITLEDPASLQTGENHRLAVIRFGAATAVSDADPREVTIGLPPLDGPPRVEIWRAPRVDETGFMDGIGYARTPDVLFGRLLITEPMSMAGAAEAAYLRLIAFHRGLGYDHLLRTWNYFPDIHAADDGDAGSMLDRYQAFCVGRHRALVATGYDETALPAATAIGSQGDGLLVYFLAARAPGEQIENPRQVSAFRYPAEYGPQSPSFSRATLKRWDGERPHLYISGTASIVGHASVHVEDCLKQLDEIVENLRAIVEAANARLAPEQHIDGPGGLGLLKVYLREPAHVAAVRERLTQLVGTRVPVLFLRGDVCRRDLWVEIEGLHAGTA